MNNKIKIIFSLIFILTLVNVNAAILDENAAEQADLASLQNETELFQSIGMGIALSIAQCDGVELCTLTVEVNEIQELINTLDQRINNLVLKQEEAEDPVEFDKVLTAYVNQKESYTAHLEKLRTMTGAIDTEDDLFDDFEFDSEVSDFPVESARNEELLDYLNDLDAFEDDELEDDEDLEGLPDLPELE